MANLRRALFRIHQTLTLNSPRILESLDRSYIGSIAHFSSGHHGLFDLSNEESKRHLYNRSYIGSIAHFSSAHHGSFDLSNEESKRRLYNRLLYRSRQRGFLELDLVLGNWVEENIRSMDELKIRALMDVLDLENPDLWKWLTGQEQPPDAVNNNPVFTAVQSKVLGNLNNHAAPETRATPGQPWVRGWDDKRGHDGGPKYGNQ